MIDYFFILKLQVNWLKENFFVFILLINFKFFLIILHNWDLHHQMEFIKILNEEFCYYYVILVIFLYLEEIVEFFLYFSIHLKDHLIFFYVLDLKLYEVILFQLKKILKLNYYSNSILTLDLLS